jgi:hypothetical protein
MVKAKKTLEEAAVDKEAVVEMDQGPQNDNSIVETVGQKVDTINGNVREDY